MVYTANVNNVMPVPTEPGVLSIKVPNTNPETNILVYVPWTFCRLAYAYAVNYTDIDATGNMNIDLELNAAAGTLMMNIDVTKSGAVGAVTEATVSTAAACRQLDRDNTARDAINVEVDGSAAAAGGVMLFMYFEREN
jgi:hypothetical protein